MTRNIEDVLYFRDDISPFLAHLTRDRDGELDARSALEQIIRDGVLKPSVEPISDAKYGIRTSGMKSEDIQRFFNAICFTETPLSEIHCLLDIAYRKVNLKPYGLVFLKHNLRMVGVSPVLYFNNENMDKDTVFQAICSLINTHPGEAAQILPLVSVFGKSILAPGATPNRIDIDFLWEREWRYPSENGPLSFTASDVFIGLCPHEEIDYFEARMPGVGFIDPRRNIKWYATKLVNARQRLNIKYSVV